MSLKKVKSKVVSEKDRVKSLQEIMQKITGKKKAKKIVKQTK